MSLKFLARAVLRPEPIPSGIGVLRRIAGTPVIFDLVSTVLQIRDRARQRKIIGDYSTDDTYLRDVHDYNAEQTVGKKFTSTRRAEILYRAATLRRAPTKTETILIIGPRDVHELFMAWVYGFAWKNIFAIDLYSTNPAIQVMNMEEMSFPDGTFDYVTMANTLAYASDTERCLTECARVLKPGGKLVFGATYCPTLDRFRGNQVSGQQVADILGRLGMRVFFHEPVDKINKLDHQQTVHFIGVTKADPDNPGFDPVAW
jgi:SAM-dependent methyltransferase